MQNRPQEVNSAHAIDLQKAESTLVFRPWPFQGQLLHGPEHSSAQSQSPVLQSEVCSARRRDEHIGLAIGRRCAASGESLRVNVIHRPSDTGPQNTLQLARGTEKCSDALSRTPITKSRALLTLYLLLAKASKRETEEPARAPLACRWHPPLRLGLLQRACRRVSFLSNDPEKSGKLSGSMLRGLMFFF